MIALETFAEKMERKHGALAHVQGLLRDAEADRDAALAAVERVRSVHSPGRIIDVWGKSVSQADDFLVCEECTDPDHNWCPWPCPTIAALDGAPEPEWEYQWGEPGESFEGFDSFASEELARAEMELDSEYTSHRVMRRRKAGAWSPIEKEQNNV